MGSLAASTPYLAVILFVVIGLWINSARSLDKQFSAFMMKETKRQAEDKSVAATDAASDVKPAA